MFSPLLQLILFLPLLKPSWVHGYVRPPDVLLPLIRDWTYQLIAPHIINMTEDLIRDAEYKLMHASKVQLKYQHTITYELGMIAAAIQDIYKHMISIYRYYSKKSDMEQEKYYLYEFLNALYTVQGEYHQIRNEQRMFWNILDKYEAQKAAILSRQRKARPKPPAEATSKNPRRAGVLWKNAEEELWK